MASDQALKAERDHALASAQTALRHATRLTRVLDVLAEPGSLDDLVDRVLSCLSELFRADIVSLLMLDGTRGLRHFAALGIPEGDTPAGGAVCDPSAEQAVRTGAPLRGSPPRADEELTALGVTTGLWLPVRGQEGLVGVLRLFRREESPFADGDVDILGPITFRIALAVEQARLHAATREQASTMAELYEIAKTMTETFDFDEVFGRIAKAALARLDAYEMSLIGLESGRPTLMRTDRDGRYPGGVPSAPPPPEQAVRDLVERLDREGVIAVADVAERPDLRGFAPLHARGLMLAAHCNDGKVVSALAVASDHPHAFGTDDQAFLRGLADVTALALRNARLYEETLRAAERDSLTGLRNRRVFWDDLEQQLASVSPDRPVALAVLDIDDFKQVNDQHGHSVGDLVLCHVANRLQRSVREGDQIYRIGGEEFVAILPGGDGAAAADVLQRSVVAVRQAREPLPPVTISVGIAHAAAAGASREALFRAADSALYRAKASGKNTVVVTGDPPQSRGA